ncbi:class I SAM-dependent methyltransferase [Actinopolymorpha alba]|uniref:class I SAM-dependent methyltransferase n=1 Tax=Actinopolymorpha alba TaxID=533267 RepID=UPI00036B55B7|nr:class I SAM-dependent methyltransferase [Actinopolymorpha alba]
MGFLDSYPADLAEWERDARLVKRGFVHPWRSHVGAGNGESFFDALVRDHLWPDSVVFDVGCGHGAYTCALAGGCARAIGVDRDPEVLELARELATERGVGNVEFRPLTFGSGAEGALAEVPERSVDVFVCRRGPVLGRWLDLARRLARPGAVAIGIHPTGPAGAVPPWNSQLPASLRLGRVFGYDEVRSWVTGALPDGDQRVRLEGCWWLDVPERFDDPAQLYARLAGAANAETSYADVKDDLTKLFDGYDGTLELRHTRLVWKVALHS